MLKVLDPLHDEGEHGEDDDRQADVQQILHRHSSAVLGQNDVIKALKRLQNARPDGFHARS
jgi:hypothetical protein